VYCTAGIRIGLKWAWVTLAQFYAAQRPRRPTPGESQLRRPPHPSAVQWTSGGRAGFSATRVTHVRLCCESALLHCHRVHRSATCSIHAALGVRVELSRGH